jgi:hypothetical protein
MKKSELVKIIRTAVRQELHESLPVVISEIMNERGSVVEEADPIELTKQVLSSTEIKQKPKDQKIYSRNEALNKVLNETVGGIPQEASRVGGSGVTDLQGNQVDVESLPDHVSNALTRNYSDVLKLVDKKRGKTT